MKAVKMELLIARLLTCGMLISALIIAVGMVLLLLERGSMIEQLQTFHGSAALSLPGLFQTMRDALHGQAEDIIEIGLISLVATPVLRVFLSILLFLRSGDYLYVAITSLVLTVLLLAFLYS